MKQRGLVVPLKFADAYTTVDMLMANTLGGLNADSLLTQPKLQKEAHQAPQTTDQARKPPSGASWVSGSRGMSLGR